MFYTIAGTCVPPAPEIPLFVCLPFRRAGISSCTLRGGYASTVVFDSIKFYHIIVVWETVGACHIMIIAVDCNGAR